MKRGARDVQRRAELLVVRVDLQPVGAQRRRLLEQPLLHAVGDRRVNPRLLVDDALEALELRRALGVVGVSLQSLAQVLDRLVRESHRVERLRPH